MLAPAPAGMLGDTRCGTWAGRTSNPGDPSHVVPWTEISFNHVYSRDFQLRATLFSGVNAPDGRWAGPLLPLCHPRAHGRPAPWPSLPMSRRCRRTSSPAPPARHAALKRRLLRTCQRESSDGCRGTMWSGRRVSQTHAGSRGSCWPRLPAGPGVFRASTRNVVWSLEGADDGWPPGPPRRSSSDHPAGWPSAGHPRGHRSGLRWPGCVLGYASDVGVKEKLSLPVRLPVEPVCVLRKERPHTHRRRFGQLAVQ